MRGLFCWADFVEFSGIKVENNETGATILSLYFSQYKLYCIPKITMCIPVIIICHCPLISLNYIHVHVHVTDRSETIILQRVTDCSKILGKHFLLKINVLFLI